MVKLFALNFGLNFYVFWSLADFKQSANIKCKKNVEKEEDKVALRLLNRREATPWQCAKRCFPRNLPHGMCLLTSGRDPGGDGPQWLPHQIKLSAGKHGPLLSKVMSPTHHCLSDLRKLRDRKGHWSSFFSCLSHGYPKG